MLVCDECGIRDDEAKVYERQISFYTGNKLEKTIIRNDLCEKHWNMLKKIVEYALHTQEDRTKKLAP